MAEITMNGQAVPPHEARTDFTTFLLIAANVLTIAAAFWFGLPLKELLLVYWVQSVMIGISFFVRMVIRIGRDSVDKFDDFLNPLFFLVHYGFFHVLYLLFLPLGKPAGGFSLFSGFGICILAFALNHAYFLWYHIRRDQAARADPSTLFWLPYARIVPMHLMLIFGTRMASAGGSLLLFLALKTVADVLMHVVERRILRGTTRRRPTPGELRSIDPLGDAAICLAVGRRDAAIAILEEALRKDPSREDMRRRLLEIKAGTR